MTALPFFVLDELHQPEGSVGIVISIFLLAAVIIRPFAGRWLDMFGKRKILLAALLLFMITSSMYFFAYNNTLLLILRFFQGLGFGLATTATGALTADTVPISRRGEGIGYYGMFMNMAMVIGPYLGLTIIQNYSFNILFVFCAIFGILAFVLAIAVKIPNQEKQSSTNSVEKFSWRQLFEPSAIPISLAAGCLAFSYSGISSFVSLFAKEIGIEHIAGFFFIVFGIVMILSRPFTGRWFDNFGPNVIIYPALCLYIIGTIVLSFTSNGFLYLLAAVIIGLGYGATTPSFQTISVQSAVNRSGAATATYFFFFDSGFGIGAYVNGIIQAKAGFPVMFLTCSAIVVCTLCLYYFLIHRKTKLRAKVEQEISFN